MTQVDDRNLDEVGDAVFRAEDFPEDVMHEGRLCTANSHDFAFIANRILKEKLGPRVYGHEVTAMGETWIEWGQSIPPPIGCENKSGFPTSTHTALLFDIKKIEEEK